MLSHAYLPNPESTQLAREVQRSERLAILEAYFTERDFSAFDALVREFYREDPVVIHRLSLLAGKRAAVLVYHVGPSAT